MDTRWKLRSHPRATVRDIMESLDEAKTSSVVHPWGGNGVVVTGVSDRADRVFAESGWERVAERTWRLPDDVYDLRTSLHYLAWRDGRLTEDGHVSEGMRTTFSRAVRRLCEAGVLIVEAPGLPNLDERRFVKKAG